MPTGKNDADNSVSSPYPRGMDDAELARQVADGDQHAWAEIYDRYADRLHDYCHSILRDRHESADALHDAFVTAATKIGQLRDPARLRPWLYSICRTQSLAALRKRSREVPDADVAEMSPPTVDRAEYADAELRDLVVDAAGGLEPKDCAVLFLHLRGGLEGKELGTALGVSAHNATVRLGRVRGHVERLLAALLVGRTGRADCGDLSDLLSGWDGSLTPLIRKRVAGHIDQCEVCGERRKRMVSPLTLLGSVPVVPAPPGLREPTLDDVALVSATRPLGTQGFGRARGWVFAAGFAGLLLVGGAVLVAQGPSQVPGDPSGAAAELRTTAPEAPIITTANTDAVTATPTESAAPPAPATAQAETTTSALNSTPAGPAEDTDPPVLSDLRTDRQSIAAGDKACGTTSASVTVLDDAPVEVVLHWQQRGDTDPHDVPMTAAEEFRYTGTIGPVGSARGGDVTWWVTATDAAGNPARSPVESLTVYPVCAE